MTLGERINKLVWAYGANQEVSIEQTTAEILSLLGLPPNMTDEQVGEFKAKLELTRKMCPDCKGSGKHLYNSTSAPFDIYESTCLTCHGSGRAGEPDLSRLAVLDEDQSLPEVPEGFSRRETYENPLSERPSL